MDIAKIFRPNVLAMKAYSSARHDYVGPKNAIFVDANENPYDDLAFNRYPDPEALLVKQKIQHWREVSPDQILLGNGSDELIDLLIRSTCVPGIDAIATLNPSYGMYSVTAAVNDVAVRKINVNKEFDFDARDLLALTMDGKVKVIFLCSPNNPTGKSIPLTQIQTIASTFEGLVVVDEAYIDFSEQASAWTLAEGLPNLVILQTFSKSLGAAGIRLGMLFAQPRIINVLNKVKPPYNINSLTQQIAVQRLDELDIIMDLVKEIKINRQILAEALSDLEVVEEVFAFDGNFIMVKVAEPDHYYQQLVQQGIVVRNRSYEHNCNGCLRITIGSPEENQKILEAFEQGLR